MDRRLFIRSLGAAGLMFPWARGWAAVGDPAPAASTPAPRLIVVMLRGAVDGLNVVAPYAEDNYARLRPGIALRSPGAGDDKNPPVLDLDGHFGLHPALSTLLPLWQARKLAFVHASGSPDPTRSHFDAQDIMETAVLKNVPGSARTVALPRADDGWMNRLLTALHPPQDATLDAVSLGPILPRIFGGTARVANIPLGREATRQTAMDKPEVNGAFDRMYANAGALGDAYREGRASREQVLADLNSGPGNGMGGGGSEPVSPEAKVADNGAPPPQGFALDATQLAMLIRRNPGLQLAFMQLGGWDTHVNEGAGSGQLANRLRPLGEGLATLVQQLGPEFEHTTIVVMSEFGRTARQNGNGGTDHGHGNAMWVLGGNVAGGKVYGDWTGIDDAALHEQRDLAVTTDFRSVLATVCARHLRLRDAALTQVFPQAPQSNSRIDAMLRA